jgi:anti-anti-sigma regulatory factor
LIAKELTMVIDSTNVIAYVEREAVVVEFKGEHDLTTRNEVASLLRLLLEEHDLVVVDISEARFIDSSFLHNLFRADARARETCRRFRVQYATASIMRACLEISGGLDDLDCVRTREEAIEQEMIA